MTRRELPSDTFERRLGRLLIALTYVAVALLGVGVGLLLVGGISPLSGGPQFHPPEIVADLLALDPAGFLWLGLLAVIVTPISRVVGAAVGFIGRGERAMALISLAILGVIAVSIGVAIATG